MGLNIKNAEVERLAAEIAAKTGETTVKTKKSKKYASKKTYKKKVVKTKKTKKVYASKKRTTKPSTETDSAPGNPDRSSN